jgi:hypothetical protein
MGLAGKRETFRLSPGCGGMGLAGNRETFRLSPGFVAGWAWLETGKRSVCHRVLLSPGFVIPRS